MEPLAVPPALQPYIPMIKGIGLGIAIFAAGWIASKPAARLVARGAQRFDHALTRCLASLVRYAVLAATVIATLGAVGVQTTSLVAIFASAGLAVGLALQGSLASFASGLMILLFRPFTAETW